MKPSNDLLRHRGARLRLATDRWLATIRPGAARRRILSTACWRFPIFSQNFVYQETVQLLNRGHDVKFLYSELDRDHPLPDQFSALWAQRRRMFLTPEAAADDFTYFKRRMPAAVDTLMRQLCEASGLTTVELAQHTHFRQSFAFARTAAAFRPDYLHSYFFYEGSLFTLVASQLLGIPRGISCYSDHLLDDYDLKVVPLQLRGCDLVIATSERIKSELLNIAPDLDPARVVVKPNAINADRFPAVSRREPSPGEPFRLICVARLDPKKGLEFLVRALALLRDRGIPVVLHVVGAVDPDQKGSAEYAAALAAEVARLDMTPWVHMEGRRDEAGVRHFFQKAHVFVAPFVELPSGDKDGIPTTILEAMATGLPVVATDAGSIVEVIEDGVTGVLVHQRRPEALAAAIEALLRDPARREALGTRGAARARSAFDVTTCEASFHVALDAVLERGRAGTSGPSLQAPRPPFPPELSLAVESRHPLRLAAATTDVVLSTPIGANLPPATTIPNGDVHASIIVVTFNNLVFNRMCLESVIANTRALRYELIVVDNASTDGTVDYLKSLAARAPQVRPLFNTANAGFAPAVNQGLAAATADILVLLNNDTMVPEYWLTRLLRHLDDPTVGLVGPVTNRAGNEAQVDVPYTSYGEFAAFARSYCRIQQGRTRDIRTLTMFCTAMRRDVYERIGPLDEQFEVGLFEDDDYSMRVRDAGLAVRCLEDAYVHHFGQASLGQLTGDGRYGTLFHANRRRWEDKWKQAWVPYESRRKPAYEELVATVRELVQAVVPAGVDVAVVSKGDAALVMFDGRPGWHFPDDGSGAYAGYHPPNSEAATTMVEALRARGVRYLVIPAASFWWLDHYQAFAEYLRTNFRCISPEPTICLILDLSPTAASQAITAAS